MTTLRALRLLRGPGRPSPVAHRPQGQTAHGEPAHPEQHAVHDARAHRERPIATRESCPGITPTAVEPAKIPSGTASAPAP